MEIKRLIVIYSLPHRDVTRAKLATYVLIGYYSPHSNTTGWRLISEIMYDSTMTSI